MIFFFHPSPNSVYSVSDAIASDQTRHTLIQFATMRVPRGARGAIAPSQENKGGGGASPPPRICKSWHFWAILGQNCFIKSRNLWLASLANWCWIDFGPRVASVIQSKLEILGSKTSKFRRLPPQNPWYPGGKRPGPPSCTSCPLPSEKLGTRLFATIPFSLETEHNGPKLFCRRKYFYINIIAAGVRNGTMTCRLMGFSHWNSDYRNDEVRALLQYAYFKSL